MIIFKVQGSASEPYTTSFYQTESKIVAQCSCPAGKMGQLCKHRLCILQGDTKGIVSSNSSDIQDVLSWIRGTDVEDALRQFQEAEKNFAEAKKQLGVIKRRLAHALLSGSRNRTLEE
jgi:hypothetical protein